MSYDMAVSFNYILNSIYIPTYFSKQIVGNYAKMKIDYVLFMSDKVHQRTEVYKF